MKKRFGLVCALMLCVAFIFSGCALFPRNVDRYLGKVVAKVDDDIVITKEDLLIGCDQYYSTFVNSYGYEQEEAIDAIINLLINQQVMLRKAKELFPYFSLSEKEKSSIWHDTYDAINSTLKGYEDEITVAEGGVVDEDEDEPEEVRKEFESFNKLAVIEKGPDGKWFTVSLDSSDDFENVEVISGGYDKFRDYQEISTQSLSEKALKKYIKALKKGEEGRDKFKNSSDDEVLARGVEKVYKNAERNFYLKKLQKYLVTSDNISVDDVLNEYRDMILEDYFKYSLSSTSFISDMKSASKDVHQIPAGQENEFFYVSHILLKYSDEQTAEISALNESVKEGEISQSEYDIALSSIQAEVEGKKLVDGVVTDETISATDLLSNLKAELSGKSNSEKADIFKKYLYWYNEDEGMMNATTAYVVGKNNSSMVESFTEDARKLDTDGVYGGVSEKLVPSEYGLHILIYWGKAENAFTVTDPELFTLQNSDIVTLYNTLLNPCGDETLFDFVYQSIYDSISSSNYSNFESKYLNQLKKDSSIKIYKKAYKDLLSD